MPVVSPPPPPPPPPTRIPDEFVDRIAAIAERKTGSNFSPAHQAQAARLLYQYDGDAVVSEIIAFGAKEKMAIKTEDQQGADTSYSRSTGLPTPIIVRHALKLLEISRPSDGTRIPQAVFELMVDGSHGYMSAMFEIGRMMSRAEFYNSPKAQALLTLKDKNGNPQTMSARNFALEVKKANGTKRPREGD